MSRQALQRRINWMFARQAGELQRPAFFDIDQTYPARWVLDRHKEAIREDVVLIVDVLRPMPWRNSVFNLFLTRVLGRHSEEVNDIRSNLRKFA